MFVLLAGLLFGVATRLDELHPHVSLGLSTSTAWLGAALVAGVRSRRPAAAGAIALTAANLGYYATGGFYGPVAAWLAVGGLAGATVGWLAHRVPKVAIAGVAVAAALELLNLHVTIAGLHLP